MDMKRSIREKKVVLWIILGASFTMPGRVLAQRSSQSNLEKLVKQAGMIFAGKVIDVETGTKDRMNLYMTAYTFQVLDPVFGVDKDTVTIKQYGGEADGHTFYPAGIPRFSRGEEVVVLLYPLSYIGMTSAVGKDQGKFWIQSNDSDGEQVVVNKLENKGLFKKLSHPELLSDQQWQNQESGPLPFKPFMATLRNLAEEFKEKNHHQR